MDLRHVTGAFLISVLALTPALALADRDHSKTAESEHGRHHAVASAHVNASHHRSEHDWRGGTDNGIGNGGKNRGIGSLMRKSERCAYFLTASTTLVARFGEKGPFKRCVTAATTTPQVISSISATSTATGTATIAFTTDRPTASKVFFGTSTPLALTATTTPFVSNAAFVKDHLVALANLAAGTLYRFVIQTTDFFGTTSTSSEISVQVK